MIKNNLIIVTATIAPKRSVFSLVLNDYQERLKQYIDSLIILLHSKYIKKIIFCDNSNYKFDTTELLKLAESLDKEIEFLFFEGDVNLVTTHGKGAGEVEIMDYIFSNSKLIKSVSYFYKLTGRLVIQNLDSVIKKCKDENYFQSHTRVDKPFVETVFYKMNCSDFLRLKNYMKYEIDDKSGIYYEHIMYNKLKINLVSYKFFPVYPFKRGISGTTGFSYNEKKITCFIKNIISKFNLMKFIY